MEYKILVIQYNDFLNGYCKEPDMRVENYYLNERKQFWEQIKKYLNYKKENDFIDLLILSDFDVDITDYKQELLKEGFHFSSISNWDKDEMIEEVSKLFTAKNQVKIWLGKEAIGEGEIELRGICIAENGLQKEKETEAKKRKEKERKEKRETYQKQASLSKLMRALAEGIEYDELQE